MEGPASIYPCPSGSPAGTPVPSGLADFSEPYSLPASIDSTSARVDHRFGSKFDVFFRLADTPSSTSARSLSSFTRTRVNGRTYTFGANSQVSGVITNQLRFGYAATDAPISSALDGFGGAQPIDAQAEAGIPSSFPTPELLFYLDFPGVGETPLIVGPSMTGTRNGV